MDSQMMVAEEIGERRKDPRSKVFCLIAVRGVNANGEPFTETCDIIDISHGGISWLMESVVWVDSLLVLDFFYSNPADSRLILRRKGTARVVRVDESEDGRYVVAACFERFASFQLENPDEMPLRIAAFTEDLPQLAA